MPFGPDVARVEVGVGGHRTSTPPVHSAHLHGMDGRPQIHFLYQSHEAEAVCPSDLIPRGRRKINSILLSEVEAEPEAVLFL